MADNYTTASGTGGNTYASDDISSVHHPYIKLEFGADNTATKVSDTDPLPIDIKELNSAAVLLGGGVESGALRVTIANDSTGVVSIDDNSANLSVDWNGTIPPIGAGTEADALRVTLATDSTGVLSVDDNGNNLSVDWDGTVPPIGGGTEVAALRVTIANDSTGILTIDHATLDNANSSDFDTGGGTDTTPSLGIAVAASGGAAVITGDVTNGLDVDVTRVGGTVTVTDDGSFTLAGNSGIDIGDVDILSIIPGTGATNLGKSIDSASSATDTGIASLAIRDDALTALTPIDGDYVPLRVNSTGALHVTGGGGGTQFNIDDAAGGTDAGTLALVVRDDALTTLTPVDGDYTQLRVNSTGALHVTGAGGGTQFNVDDASGSTDTGTLALVVRDDALTTLTPIDGDYTQLRVNSTGALHVTGAGGGTQFNVDDVAGGTATGTLSLVVRDDALTTLTPIDGDYTQLRVNSTGALHVTGGGGGTEYNEAVATPDPIIGTATLVERIDVPASIAPAANAWAGLSCSAEGALWVQDFNSDAILSDTTAILADTAAIQTAVEIIDNAVHTRNEAFGESFAIGGELDDTATTAATEGNVSPIRITAQRAAHINLRNNAGTEIGTSGDPVRIDPTGTTAQPVTKSGTWTLDSNSGTDIGDVTINNSSGGSAVNIQDGGNSITIDGTVTSDAGTGTFVVGGVAAHDAAVSGNPVLLAGEARTTNPTAVADGDVVRLHADDHGRLVTRPHASRDRTAHNRITLTSTTETTLIAAVASVFRDLVMLTLSNESATEVRVDIRDSTAGTIRLSMDLAPDGGGAVIPFPVPLPQATVNNNWTAQLSAAVSTVYITAVAVENN